LERPDRLPCINEDFRLHFDFWSLNADKRAEAFAILPGADPILARIEAHLACTNVELEPDAAVALLSEGLRRLAYFDVERPPERSEVRLLDESMMSLHDAFKSADNPCYAIEDESYDMASRQSGSVGPKVLSFLNEPLYRISNSITLVHWATWPLCASENAPDVFEPFYLLERGCHSILINQNRM
jgi:hypothetical protein